MPHIEMTQSAYSRGNFGGIRKMRSRETNFYTAGCNRTLFAETSIGFPPTIIDAVLPDADSGIPQWAIPKGASLVTSFV